jgi:hypothetical protein
MRPDSGKALDAHHARNRPSSWTSAGMLSRSSTMTASAESLLPEAGREDCEVAGFSPG